jgi:seryl-tRNA synthetase
MHVKKASYIELQPPVLINPDILYGTGHLPKSKEDMFETMNGQFLSPTEEVPLTGYYRNEIIDEKQLPIHLTASTVSFRSEAGSAGKDVRGVIRQHQFYNTEMVCICKPEQSMDELEKMTSECEAVLKALEIPYRVITLCTGDMGSAAIKTYDVEV